MAEKKFFLESSTPIQEIGMRAQVISFLIAQGFKEGNALNDSDDVRKVIVAIRSDEIAKIETVKKDLVTHLNKLNHNDLCYSEFPSDLRASGLMDLSNPHYVPLLALSDVSSSLMLEQTSKGVGAMRLLVKPLQPLQELPVAIKELSAKIQRL